MSDPIGDARQRAREEVAAADAALASRNITEEEWYERIEAALAPVYLASSNPRAQSGHSGDEPHWEQARSIILDAVDHGGSLLDVGCANGYLMESLHRWSGDRDIRLEPYGIDISPRLVSVARRRLPHWSDRIWLGNVISWTPPRPFDYVRTGLEYVPPHRQAALIDRLLTTFVRPGGRVIVGTYNELPDDAVPDGGVRTLVESWGFTVAGSAVRPHRHDERHRYKALWIDAA